MSKIKKYYKICQLLLFIITTTSCAPEHSDIEKLYSHLPKIEGFEIAKIFYINDKTYSQAIDNSGNQLFLKYSKKDKKWERTKFTSNR